jgi:AcrR family transcriptional regulator
MTRKRAIKQAPEQSKTELRNGITPRPALLNAVTKFFMEKAFEATIMGQIAKQAHASTETFYRHFPTKETLFS